MIRTFVKYLPSLKNSGLKVNPDKCIFGANHITFAGHELSAKGIAPQQSRIDSIKQIAPPTNAKEVRSFLRMVNFVNKFIKDFSTITAPLRLLTRQNQQFYWGSKQQAAFATLKASLTCSDVVAYYDPEAHTQLIVDASPIGLGAILAQRHKDGNYRPISYGSTALNNVQQRYSQTEREALAVLWACQHFHHYVYDRDFTVVTDHKPLLHMLTPKSNPPPRIQNWMLKLQAYDFEIQHVSGCNMA